MSAFARSVATISAGSRRASLRLTRSTARSAEPRARTSVSRNLGMLTSTGMIM